MGGTLYTLTVVFSLVSGTAAGLLSLLAWETLRQSPFGRAVFVLSLIMGCFILYHVFALLYEGQVVVLQSFKSVLFTGTAAFIWTMVWSQHRVRTNPVREGGSR